MAQQLRRIHFKRVDVAIIKYLKSKHGELYVKLRSAVQSAKRAH